VDRSERPGREDACPEIVLVFTHLFERPAAGPWIRRGSKIDLCLHWIKGSDLARTHRVPSNPIDRGVKLAFVSRKLLQSSHASAAPNDGDEIAVLHLFVDKLLQGTPCVVRAFERQRQVVDNERYR